MKIASDVCVCECEYECVSGGGWSENNYFNGFERIKVVLFLPKPFHMPLNEASTSSNIYMRTDLFDRTNFMYIYVFICVSESVWLAGFFFHSELCI